MNVPTAKVHKYGVDQFRVKPIRLSPVLIHEMTQWKDSTHKVFEGMLILTNAGNDAVEITVNEIAKFTKVSVARVYEAIGFLEENNFLCRYKAIGGRQANTYWIPNELLSTSYVGDLLVTGEPRDQQLCKVIN